jgi:hypothetical protein
LGGRTLDTVTDDDPLWTGVAHALAQMCHTMLLTTGPRRILIGGGVANGQPHLRAMIEAMVRQSVAGYMPLPDAPFILPPALGDQAGPLGPIALALDALDGELCRCGWVHKAVALRKMAEGQNGRRGDGRGFSARCDHRGGDRHMMAPFPQPR